MGQEVAKQTRPAVFCRALLWYSQVVLLLHLTISLQRIEWLGVIMFVRVGRVEMFKD